VLCCAVLWEYLCDVLIVDFMLSAILIFSALQLPVLLLDGNSKPIPDVPNRVEFLPVLWFDGVHNESSSMKETLKSV